jgi:hypothetical protein
MDKRTALKKGIDEFNNGDYFDCHETLEELWMVEADSDRTFYQGLLQLSVGCFHLLNENYRGAGSQWRRGCAKLEKFSERHLGVDVKSLLAQMRRCQEMLQRTQSGPEGQFDFSMLPQIRYSE